MSSQSLNLPTINSSQRANLTPSLGDVYYESDTNRIIYYSGESWIFYGGGSSAFMDPAGLVVSSSLNDRFALNYPGGLFSSSSANFYVKKTPMFHFDASRPGGLQDPFPKAEGTKMLVAGDCSPNAFVGTSRPAQPYSYIEIQTFSSLYLSNGSSARPGAVFPYTSPLDDFDIPFDINHISHPSMTLFVVQCSTTNGFSSPFAPYGSWSKDVVLGQVKMFNKAGNYPPGTSTRGVSWFQEGPALTIGRRTPSNTKIWNTRDGGLLYDGASTSFSITHLFHYLTINYELILFDTALDIPEIVTIKDYLQLKYRGIGPNMTPPFAPL